MDGLDVRGPSLEELRLKKEATAAEVALHPAHPWLQAEAVWADTRYQRALAAQQGQGPGCQLQAA